MEWEWKIILVILQYGATDDNCIKLNLDTFYRYVTFDYSLYIPEFMMLILKIKIV